MTTTATPTSEKVILLWTMLGKAGEMHYTRIKLAKEILSDKDWLVSNFNGDQVRAGEALEKNYFGDLCGAISFWRLLRILEEFPNLSDWEKHKFNLTEMSAIIDIKTKKKKSSRWSVTQQEVEELESDKNRFKRLYEQAKEELSAANQRIAELEKSVSFLTKEKARLTGQLAELQQIIDNDHRKTA